LPAPSCPLPPWRYRALRARYNALLVTLYERTSLTLREIAAVAGRTDRAVQIMVRALGCRPRNARTCRPGTDVGVRRAGPKPPPLSAAATQRAVADFASVARELAASAEARVASDLQRATARAKRRAASAQTRTLTGTARRLAHLATVMEHMGVTRRMLATESLQKSSRKPAKTAKPAKPSRADMQRAQERALREQEARMWQAHQAHRTEAAPLASPLGADGAGRAGRVAEHAWVPQKPPRIRRL
jgi:hypothetical protein